MARCGVARRGDDRGRGRHGRPRQLPGTVTGWRVIGGRRAGQPAPALSAGTRRRRILDRPDRLAYPRLRRGVRAAGSWPVSPLSAACPPRPPAASTAAMPTAATASTAPAPARTRRRRPRDTAPRGPGPGRFMGGSAGRVLGRHRAGYPAGPPGFRVRRPAGNPAGRDHARYPCPGWRWRPGPRRAAPPRPRDPFRARPRPHGPGARRHRRPERPREQRPHAPGAPGHRGGSARRPSLPRSWPAGGSGRRFSAAETFRGSRGRHAGHEAACRSTRSRTAGVTVPVQPWRASARPAHSWLSRLIRISAVRACSRCRCAAVSSAGVSGPGRPRTRATSGAVIPCRVTRSRASRSAAGSDMHGVPGHDAQRRVPLLGPGHRLITLAGRPRAVTVTLGPRNREEPRLQHRRIVEIGDPRIGEDDGVTGRHLGFFAAAQNQPAVLVEVLRVRFIELPGRVRGARAQGRDYIG